MTWPTSRPPQRKRWGGRPAARLRDLCFRSKGRTCVLQLPGFCTGVATHAHHVIPRSLGGPDTLANLVPACAECNREQGNKLTADALPAEHPAMAFFSRPRPGPDALRPGPPPAPDQNGHNGDQTGLDSPQPGPTKNEDRP